MNRRQFTASLNLGAIGFALRRPKPPSTAAPPQVAITMDDFTWSANTVRLTGDERNRAILAALQALSLKAALFVRASNIEAYQGKALLKSWDTAGHLIANHTYSHWSYNDPQMTSTAFEQDILRAERLLKDFPRFRKLFRFPFLKEGDTAAKRDAMRSFLAAHGYRTGHVTIDTSDWVVDDRLRKRLTKDPAADLTAEGWGLHAGSPRGVVGFPALGLSRFIRL
jgi:peptidoglycan/xylan/chitin deacetylase (PgdA/CDA1 family)